MSSEPTCFVAYPSKPPSLAETIEGAIDSIKKGQLVAIDGWKCTSVSGKFVMTAICKAIEQRSVLVCDLTNLNHNVLFELGYAIAKKKRVWILLDPSMAKSREDYERFRLLTTVGYTAYSNSREIEEAFYREEPHLDLESTIYRDAIESVIGPQGQPTLLYLKSGVDTEASVKLSRRVHTSPIPSVVDDPHEVRVQTLSWYAQKVYSAYAVVAHFLSPEHTGWRLHNAKNSFVSGLAYGFGKHLLMLAHEPYESPIDYRELLMTHQTAARCEQLADGWLAEVEGKYDQRALGEHEYAEELRAHSELQSIAIGDPIAEHESDDLPTYFVRTAAYAEALRCGSSIFVGRKGSGKTAILYKLAEELGSDPRNHVCVIKPVAYEVEGVLRMLRQALPGSEQGYLVESFWKFLIYTELAKSVSDSLRARPAHYRPDDAEERLLHFVQANAPITTEDFSIRLESVVGRLQHLGALPSGQGQRARISELLHMQVIGRLRSILGNVLQERNKVAVLVDNLDKAWRRREDLPQLSELLFGLLGVTSAISRDFQKSDHWRRPVSLSLLIFLRSDIFGQIIKYARERDKISYIRIAWDDPEVLLRVLEERFLASTSAISSPGDVWSRYFCATVSDVPTRQYLATCILPRPRDLIYLCNTALGVAVNRRHTRLEQEDIIEAQQRYSQYALDSLVVENGTQVEQLEALLYEFAGGSELVDRNDVLRGMSVCGIDDNRLDEVIDLLCELTFLGREVHTDRFEFLYNEEDKAKIQALGRKTARARPDGRERFRINEAFHAYLEIHAG